MGVFGGVLPVYLFLQQLGAVLRSSRLCLPLAQGGSRPLQLTLQHPLLQLQAAAPALSRL